MDRLLCQQIICALTKSPDSPPDAERVQSLFDRLLSTTRDAASLGQVIWYCTKQRANHQVAIYMLNRLVENATKWNLASVVDFAHSSECTTSLHHASYLANLPLIELLLQLGANVWRQSARGKIPLHFALKQLQIKESSDVIDIIRVLCRRMTISPNPNEKPEELLRKFAIVPAAIEVDKVVALEIIDQCWIAFDYRHCLEYFEFALQLMASDAVTGYLLAQMKRCVKNQQSSSSVTSPIGLALQYNNLYATLQSIRLGFHCSSSLLDNGFIHLRRTLISQRHSDRFAVANQCFHFLMQQLRRVCSDLTDPKAVQILHQFVSHQLSFTTCYRVNEPEVALKANYLTFALLNHCGSMAHYLAQMPIPIQFPVEANLLRYYRYSRHDEPALKCLVLQNRICPRLGPAKLAAYFQNCQPLYDTSMLVEPQDAASEEYEQDRIGFQQFCNWLDKYSSEPQTLVSLARNVIINRRWKLESDEESHPNDGAQTSLQRVAIVAKRIQQVQTYLGKKLFNSMFCLHIGKDSCQQTK